ncbi:MAG TPA: AMP-binding protein [Solirubrobacteraceae bacterium]|nr:AMP-binding protein [Solirubrobacteraceae bacterium]
MYVDGWLARAVAAHPRRIALETTGERWSYAQLHDAADIGARELRRRGAAPGARVAIALAPGLGFAQALHACLLLGAVAVPVDQRLTPAEQASIAAGAAVLVDEPLPPPGKGAPGVAGGTGVALGGGAHEEPLLAKHRLGAVAAVIHTSGTSAAPRPVELTYGNFLWSALGSAVALGLEREERWLCTLPVSHVAGLSILVRSCIYATTAVVHERFEADRALHALRDGDVTIVSVVATTLARLLDAGLEHPPALRCALAGGGSVPPGLMARAREHGLPVALTYGLTEACSQVSTTPLAALGEPRRGSRQTAGPPLFCTRVRIASDGEILVSGPTVAPGATAGDGWLHTGDLGELDDGGRLAVAGRRADTIVSGGENVAPAEVEAALESHPDVLEAGVVGRSDARWGEIVTALVVVRPGTQVTVEELRAHCARTLATYKTPKQVTLVSEPLPRTASGKLLRRELAESSAHQRR